jgi:hypothetical protein
MTHKHLIHIVDVQPGQITVTGINQQLHEVSCLNVTFKDQDRNTFIHNLDETTAYRLYKQLQQYFNSALKYENATANT